MIADSPAGIGRVTAASFTVTARCPFGGRARAVSVAVAVSVQAVSQPTRTGRLRAPIRPVRRKGRTESCGPTGPGSVGSFGAGGFAGAGRAAHGAAAGAVSWNCWTRLLSVSVTVRTPRQ